MKYILVIISILILTWCATDSSQEVLKSTVPMLSSWIRWVDLVKIEDWRVTCYVYQNVGISCVKW